MKNIIFILLTFFLLSCNEFEHSNPFDPEYNGEGGKLSYETKIEHYTVTEYLDWGTKIEYNLDIYIKHDGNEQIQFNGEVLNFNEDITLTDSENKRYILNPGQTDKSNFPFRFELSKSISKPYYTNFVFLIDSTSTYSEWSDSLTIVIN